MRDVMPAFGLGPRGGTVLLAGCTGRIQRSDRRAPRLHHPYPYECPVHSKQWIEDYVDAHLFAMLDAMRGTMARIGDNLDILNGREVWRVEDAEPRGEVQEK